MAIDVREELFESVMVELIRGGTLIGALESVYEAGYTTGFKVGFDEERGGNEENGHGASTQSLEVKARLSGIRRIVDKHLNRLEEILAANRNSGCGGDGSMSEDQWYSLRDRIGILVWISKNFR